MAIKKGFIGDTVIIYKWIQDVRPRETVLHPKDWGFIGSWKTFTTLGSPCNRGHSTTVKPLPTYDDYFYDTGLINVNEALVLVLSFHHVQIYPKGNYFKDRTIRS
jgi:hypothetical protein